MASILDPDYLIDMNGGVYRFPAQPGIYALVFNPDDDGRTYVGAAKNIRQRVQCHIKGGAIPAWASRLAVTLMEEELRVEPGSNLRSHPDYFNFAAYARRSTDAKVLELFDFDAPADVIARAENRWMEELSPALNAPNRSTGGYCWKPRPPNLNPQAARSPAPLGGCTPTMFASPLSRTTDSAKKELL